MKKITCKGCLATLKMPDVPKSVPWAIVCGACGKYPGTAGTVETVFKYGLPVINPDHQVIITAQPAAITPPYEPKLKAEDVFKHLSQPSQQETGKKHDQNKPRWALTPWHAQSEVVAVLTYGAEKYGDDNWKQVQQAKPRYTSACFRHITAWLKGERNDPESGLHHLAHAICCLLFLLEKELTEAEK